MIRLAMFGHKCGTLYKSRLVSGICERHDIPLKKVTHWTNATQIMELSGLSSSFRFPEGRNPVISDPRANYPFGVQAFKLAGFALWPFGRVMVPRRVANVSLSAVGNIVWLLVGGIWLAIGHVFAAVLNAITIIGLPFAVAHLKLAGAALTPFGNQVVPLDEAVARGHEVRVLVEPIG